MLLKSETYKHQKELSEFCRTGVQVEIEGTIPDRLPHYRRLIFNVIKDALETTYPISFKYINQKIWDELVYNFFSQHDCLDPQVWRMPKEFYRFCIDENFSKKYNLPYLNNLLYFEWMEAEMYMMEDSDYPDFRKTSEWLKERIAVNPEHKIIKLEYPVHLEKPEVAVEKKGNYFLLLYREKESGKVQFVNLSVLFAFLLENIVLQEKTLEEIFNEILLIFGINDLRLLQNKTFKFLEDLHKRGFILGVLN